MNQGSLERRNEKGKQLTWGWNNIENAKKGKKVQFQREDVKLEWKYWQIIQINTETSKRML